MILCNKCKEACKGEVLKASEHFFHHSCFVCDVCGCQLASEGYYEHNGSYLCRTDFKKRVSRFCDLCGLTIHGETVSVFEKYFHRHCFICSTCKGSFSPGAQVTLWNREFYCIGCFPKRKGVGFTSQFGNLKQRECPKKKNGTIDASIRKAVQNSTYEHSTKLLSRVPAHEDTAINFGKELTERLAVQYNACQKHISDGTTKCEPLDNLQPSGQEKATANTLGISEQLPGVENSKTATKPGLEDEATEDAKSQFPVRPDKDTPSAMRHLNSTSSTNSLSKRRRRKPYDHTGIQSGRVAELIRFMEELSNKRNASPNSIVSDNAETPRKHARPVSAKSSEKLQPEAKGDLCVSMVNNKSSSKASSVNSQLDRISQAAVEVNYLTERPKLTAEEPKKHRRVAGPQRNRSLMSKHTPNQNVERRWLGGKATKETPVQRVWHPVRPTPSLPAPKETAYRPTPFVEAGYLHHTQVKVSCANSQTCKSDDVKPDSSVAVDSVEETSPAAPDGLEDVVMKDKSNVTVLVRNNYDEEKVVSIPTASHLSSHKQPSHTDEISSTTDANERIVSQKSLSISNIRQRKNRRISLYQRFRGRVYIQGKNILPSELFALVSSKRKRKQANGQKCLDPTRNGLKAVSLTFGGLVWRLTLASLCLMVMLAVLVWIADHKPLAPNATTDEDSAMCSYQTRSLNAGTHKISATAVRS